MQTASNFIVLNIREYLENDDKRLGEDKLLQLLSEFSCPLNPDVERFLKQQSIEFAKKHQAVTYLLSVNDVDPENATEIEMFALMSHLDKTGQSKNEGMSSFSKMRTYSQQAERNGFCSGIADINEAWNSKRN